MHMFIVKLFRQKNLWYKNKVELFSLDIKEFEYSRDANFVEERFFNSWY
jgi:hypothetical protein